MMDIEQAKAEWEDIRADPDTTIRREKWAVWANTTGLALLTENTSLRKQLEVLEGALRIVLWNAARDRGLSQDEAIKNVDDSIEALKGKP